MTNDQFKISFMKRNIGSAEIAIRFIIAAVIVGLRVKGIISGTAGVILLVLAAVLALTALLSFSPLWALLGINTRKKEKNQ